MARKLDTVPDGMSQVSLPDGPIAYRESGAGPTVVFVHGVLVNGTLWREVVPLLEGSARCIVPDWPLGSHELPLERGADRTPAGQAKRVVDFLAALDLTDVTLVGNDSGGAVSQIVCAHHPDRIGRLVLTSCDAFENFFPPLFKPLTVGAKLGPIFTASIQPLRLRALQRAPFGYGWLAKHRIADDLLDSWTARIFSDARVRRDAVGFLRTVHKRYTLDAAARLSGFAKPALIAWSEDDRFFPLDHGRRLATILPSSRFETIPDAGTFSALDQPERLASLIADFLAK